MIRSMKRLKAALSSGDAIRETHLNSGDGSVVWHTEATNQTVDSTIVAKAREQGLLKPCGDGLFGDS